MSRAFVKEDGEAPPLVVPRAPLPDGVPNYVTRRGLSRLHQERSALEAQRPDAARSASVLSSYNARLGALEQRIASAVVPDPALLPHDEVRFSAAVTLRDERGDERRYRIVGVDEAQASAGRIAFTAPLARELAGKRAGDVITVRQAQGELELEIVAIDYTQED